MADLKISELGSLAGGDLVAGDELAIVDGSASETKKIGVGDLIENGVTLISDDAIPGAKILFAAGDIVTADLADDAVTADKVADNAITAAHLADESTVDLVTTLPASGAFTGQLALDTDDNKLYVWDGSSWLTPEAGVSDVDGSTTGIVNIVSTISGDTVTISATLDDTTAAAQFLAGPVGAAGTVGYRAIDGGDLPLATTTSKGAVIVNGSGLQMNGDNIEIANTVTASSVSHLVTYDANGLITGGAAIAAGDLPIATDSSVGGVIVGDGLDVNASGVVSVDNTVTAGEYTKVTVTERGLVSSGGTLDADDIPDHSAAKLTSGTIGTSLIASDAITAAKLADQSTTKFGGALGSDNVTIFPDGDFKGQFFWDETTQDLYLYSGSAFVPVTVLSGNLVNAGAYNASTNQMSSVTSAGSSAGFSVGNALPAPAKTNLNHYVVVDTSGTGSGAAPAVALAPPDMLLSQGVGTEYSLIDVSNAIAGQTASNISLIATGDVIATDVQAAITELDTEKLPKAGGTMTGDLELNNADIVFEGSTADDYETTLTVTDPTADRSIVLPDVSGDIITTGDTGTVTSTMIANGTIANADISSSAEIAVSKLANGTARQLLQTNAAGTAPEFTSNIDVPGTLDVTGAATLDSTLTVTGLISADGKVSFPAGTAAAPSVYFGTDTDTGFFSGGSDFIGISTGGTARININSSGQVGIGVALPSALFELGTASPILRFSDTDTTGHHQIQSSNANFIINADPGDDDTGSAISFKVDNSDAMRIISDGSVGIGTTSPAATLQVVAADTDEDVFAIRREDHATTNLIRVFQDSTIGSGTGGAHINVPNNTLVVTTDTNATAGNGVCILSSGNVGIGTASPDEILHIAAASEAVNTRDGVLFQSTSSLAADTGLPLVFTSHIGTLANYGVASIAGRKENATSGNAAGYLQFATGDSAGSVSEKMRIDSNGNVGIGVTSIGNISNRSQLVIGGSSGGLLQFDVGSTNEGRIFASDGELLLRASQSDGEIVFQSGGSSESARITSDGELLVGTTSAIAAAGKESHFQVSGTGQESSSASLTRFSSSNQAPSLVFGKANGAAVTNTVGNGTQLGRIEFAGSDGTDINTVAARIDCYVDGTPGSNDMPGRIRFLTNGGAPATGPTEHFRIASNGDLTATDTTIGSNSDSRLKTNVADFTYDLEDFKQYQPKTFDWKNPDLHGNKAGQRGFIAQDVEAIDSYWVDEQTIEEDSADAEFLGADRLAKTLKLGKKDAMYVSVIQQLLSKIETLETKVAALEAGN